MKKILLLGLFMALSTITFAQSVFFSEYAEGSSNNKALEIYNGTAGPINLQNYNIKKYSNGSATPSSPSGGLNLPSATLNAGEVYVVVNNNAASDLKAKGDLLTTSAVMQFNGDDAITLEDPSGTVLDIIGTIGTDPGSQWGSGQNSTADNTISRKAGTTDGDTDGTNDFDTDLTAGWDGHPNNYWDGFGVAAPLPIDLTLFYANQKGSQISIAWETATETNNEFFTIERSVEGSRFEAIGKVEGAGNSTTALRYEFADKTPMRGTNYYRLTQTDYDGQSETFDVVTVDFKVNGTVTINPTQVKDIMTLSLEPIETIGRVAIFNLIGQKVYDEAIEVGSSSMEIDAAAFARGQYFARVTNGSLVETVRFIKQ